MQSQPGEKHGRALLTEVDVLDMRRLRTDYGLSYRDIAEWWGIAPATAKSICRGRRWRHVPMPASLPASD